MNIEQLLDKREKMQLSMLRLLILKGGRLKVSALRDEMDLSRTAFEDYVRHFIDLCQTLNLPVQMTYDEAELTLKMSYEYRLDELVEIFILESIPFKILDFLLVHKSFTIVQLTQELAISEASVFRKIKQLNTQLKEFGLTIKNGQILGDELQIRYFYYQMYQFVLNRVPIYMQITPENKGFITALEKVLKTKFSDESIDLISRWFGITRKRIKVEQKEMTKTKKLMAQYEEDALYKDIDRIVTLYFSRTSMEVNPVESMIFYSFLVSFPVMNEEATYRFELLRSKTGTVALVDVHVRETLLQYYRPRRFSIEMEKKIGYHLSNIHNELYFFTGHIEKYHMGHMFEKQKQVLGNELSDMVDKLTEISLKALNQTYDHTNTLHLYLPHRYVSVLSMIDFYLEAVIKIGIDLAASFKEPIYQLLMTEIRPILGVEIEMYKESSQYDLMITSKINPMTYPGKPVVYRLSEFASAYDLIEIKACIDQIKKTLAKKTEN